MISGRGDYARGSARNVRAPTILVPMPRVFNIALLVVGIYAAWLAMMALHEAGHVLHAWLSGGTVENVELPLLGFSRTDLANNPHPAFVAWGGAVWGSMLPLAILAAARLARWRYRHVSRFFAGFCLIANGAYLAVGWLLTDGDAADLVRLGAPTWTLIASGVAAVAFGLLLWHGLGPRFGLGSRPARR